MKLSRLIYQIGIGLNVFCFVTTTHAVTYWTFSPAPDNIYPPQAVVSPTGKILVRYTVTNKYFTDQKTNLLVAPASTTINPARYNPYGISLMGTCSVGPRGNSNPITGASTVCTFVIDGETVTQNGGMLTAGPLLCRETPMGINLNQCNGPANPLSISVDWAVSVKSNDNPHLTGNARKITLKNNGSTTTQFSVATSDLPEGTDIDASDCQRSLKPNDLCNLVVNPGQTASHGANGAACTTGVAPIPAKITITAKDGRKVTTVNLTVLGYGCIYHGGFVYAVDDTKGGCTENTGSPCVGSIGGKVAATSDRYAEAWSPYLVYDLNARPVPDIAIATILGIDDRSTAESPSPIYPSYPPDTPIYKPCNGLLDGACDTDNIVSYFNYNYGPTNHYPHEIVSLADRRHPYDYKYVVGESYAAKLCSQYSTDASGKSPCTSGVCYKSWYLPSICEMGYDSTPGNQFRICPNDAQNIQSSLVDSGILPILYDSDFKNPKPTPHLQPQFYSSSTEFSDDPSNDALYNVNESAWYQYFGTPKSKLNTQEYPHYPMQMVDDKTTDSMVRCSQTF